MAADITALASLITAIALAISVVLNRRAIRSVHDEVRTSNGLTLAALADRAEGRRIGQDIDPENRTKSEQHYVDELGESPTE